MFKRLLLALLAAVVLGAVAAALWLMIGIAFAALLPRRLGNVSGEVQLLLIPLSMLLGAVAGVVLALTNSRTPMLRRVITTCGVLVALSIAVNVAVLLLQ